MPTLGSLAIALLILAVVFSIIERIWPALQGKRLWRHGIRTDLIYWFFTPVVTRFASRIAVIVVVVPLALMLGAPLQRGELEGWFAARQTWIGGQPIWIQVLVGLLLMDLISYWMHRFFHRGRLWRFHAIHHASAQLDWLSSVRLHPINDVLSRVVHAVPLFALGFDPKVLAGAIPFFAFYALLVHANVPWTFGPLRVVIASPTFHRWHHTSQQEGLNKNFSGLFPFFDLLFGTFYMPKGRIPEQFGVAGEAVPEGIWGQLLYPFKNRS